MDKKQKLIDDAISFISNNGYKGDSISIFKKTAEFLSELLSLDFIIIDKFSENSIKILKTIVFHSNEGFLPNISYELKNTPCEGVVNKDTCVYAKEVQTHFPLDDFLIEKGIDSYIGVPLWNSNKEVIGLIAIMNKKPFKEPNLYKSIAQIAALKMEKVLEKLLFEEEIKKKNTKLKLSKNKIFESEEKFKKLSTLTFEGILIHENGIAKDVNLSFEKMFGYDKKELLNKNIVNILFPKKYHQVINDRIQQNYTYPYEIEGIRKNGSKFPVEIEARYINFKNSPNRITAIRDISKRNKSERENRKLKKAVEQSDNIIVITDIDGNVEYTNPKFSKVTGYTAKDIIGKSTKILNSGYHSKDYYKNLWDTIKQGNTWSGEFRNKSKKGKISWEQATISPIKNNDNEIVNFLAIKEDITEKKDAEKKLSDAYETIKKNEDYLKTILKTANEGFWIIGLDHKTLEVNIKMANILGVKMNEIVGKSIFDFVDKKNSEVFKKQIKLRDEGFSTSYEIELQNSKAQNITCKFNTSPIYDKNEVRIGSFALVTDISDIKANHKKLKKNNKELKQLSIELSEKNKLYLESEQRYKDLFEYSPVSLWEEDFSEVKEFINSKKIAPKELLKYLNSNREFLIDCISKIKIINVNKGTLDLIGVDSIEELTLLLRTTNTELSLISLAKEINAVALNKSSFYGETCFTRADGKKIAAIVKSEINSNGKAIVSVIDITSLENAKKEIEKNERKFRDLFEKSGDGILIMKNGIFVDCNQAIVSMMDYKKKEDFINSRPSDLSPKFQSDGEESLKKEEKMMNIAIKNGSHRFEWLHTKSNGDVFPVEVLLTTINNNSKEIIIHCVWRDITERNKVRKELIESKNKAEESNRLKTEFLNNMSHEIRTPMNGIVGFSKLLENDFITPAKRKYFTSIIQNSSKQLLHIIDDILEISRLETKQVRINESEVNLNDLLLELFSVFDLKAKENNIPLYLKNDLKNDESLIFTDVVKLNKILSNLLENALKFTNKGKIVFGYKIKDNKIKLFVEDSGIGILKSKQKLIFERFSREESVYSRNVGGLGLGLSIAKENTELLGGEIFVESEVLKGSTFYITIPFKPAIVKSSVNEIEKNKKESYNVLIVEDDEVNCLFLEILLNEQISIPFNLTIVNNGKEAVEICENNSNFDLVFMDLNMPVMDGYEATEIIKKRFPKIPIIAQTAFSSLEDRGKAVNSGCSDFITKPIKLDELGKVISKFLINKNSLV